MRVDRLSSLAKTVKCSMSPSRSQEQSLTTNSCLQGAIHHFPAEKHGVRFGGIHSPGKAPNTGAQEQPHTGTEHLTPSEEPLLEFSHRTCARHIEVSPTLSSWYHSTPPHTLERCHATSLEPVSDARGRHASIPPLCLPPGKI